MHWPRTEAAEVANAMIEAELFYHIPLPISTPSLTLIMATASPKNPKISF